MWNGIFVLLLVMFAGFVIGFNNAAYQQELDQRLKERGILSHIEHVKVVKGIPDIDEGSNVTIDLYDDKITINNNQIIPLAQVKRATTYKVKSFSLNNKNVRGNTPARWHILKCIWKSKHINFLAIELTNKYGPENKCLFITHNYLHTKRFADTVNKQTHLF